MSEQSKQVFSLRKQGRLQEAYDLAHLALEQGDRDEWLRIALGWVLIDLIKNPGLDANEKQQYMEELKPIQIESESFQAIKERVLHFASPFGQLISQAKQLSNEQHHHEAVNYYLKALQMEPESVPVNLGLGWQYYYLCRDELQKEHPDAVRVKRWLANYYRLRVHEAPSPLHSQMLRMACKLHKVPSSNLNFYKFLRCWDIKNFQPEDSNPYGKSPTSLKENAISLAAKDLIETKDYEPEDVNQMIELLDAASAEFTQNLWFDWYLSKLYLKIGNRDESLKKAVKVARVKNREYWIWEWIGDFYQHDGMLEPIVFYAKALTLQKDLDFICNLKVKFAQELLKKELFAQAQCELLAVKNHATKLSSAAKELMNQPWMQQEVTVTDNTDLYLKFAQKSDEVLFEDIPWKRACLGERFVHPKTHKPNYRIYLEDDFLPLECLLEQIRYGYKQNKPGTPLFVKTIQESARPIKIVAVKLDQDSEPWSIFSDYVGAVSNVSHKNHCFAWVVNSRINGNADFNVLDQTPTLGMPLQLRVAQFHTKNGMKQKVVTAQLSDSASEESIRRFTRESFTDCEQFAFTSNNVFIPPELWNEVKTSEDTKTLSGSAVLSFNHKKEQWNWKAFKVEVDKQSDIIVD